MADENELRTPKKWIVCSEAQYQRWANNTSGTGTTIDPYNLYLVNTGVEAGARKYTELYYGYNRLSDIQIVPVNDSSIVNLPNDKLIVFIDPVPDDPGNGNGTTKYTVNGLRIKYDDQIWSIADFSFKRLEKSGNTLIMEVGGNASSVSTQDQPIYIPILGSLPPEGDGNHYLNDLGEYTVPSGGLEYTASGDYINVDNTNHTISTTLHAGTNVTIGADGSINATGGGGGGTTYTAGDGISISGGTTPTISVNYGSGLSINNHQLVADLSGADYSGSDYIDVVNTGTRAINLRLTQLINKLTDLSDSDSLINTLLPLLSLDDGRIE